MTRSITWRGLMLGCAVLLFSAPTSVRADEKGDKNKGKKDEKPNVIQLDLNKLPPDLAKVLQKYATDGKKPAVEGKKTDKKPSGPTKLPPGLANKAADHPGRVAWLKAHGSGEPEKGKKKDEEKGKKKDKSKKGGDDDN